MNRWLVTLMLLGSLLLFGCNRKAVLPDLRESYIGKDTKPFGGNIAFRILQNSFPDNYIQISKAPFLNGIESSSDKTSIYFCITRHFFTKEQEVDAIMDYVSKGNTFFLAASDIDSLLLQRIACKVQRSEMETIIGPVLQQSSVSFVKEVSSTRDSFSYFFMPFSSSISEFNENFSRPISNNSYGKPNCISYFSGKGKLILHTDPRAFSNYFLLTGNNYQYLKQILQLTNQYPEHIYWNEYYARQSNRNSGKPFSSFSEMMKHRSLGTAFLITLALLLLFVIFGIKRKQRIIKVIPPNVNSSIAFTETIARLYLQEKNNKNIAEKMISYFNEFIRSNYFLYANPGSDEFIKTLSRKSGVSLDRTVSLYRAIQHAGKAGSLDDYQLLSLNEQIQQFYKKRK